MTSARLARTTVLRTRLPDGGDNAVPRGYTKCGAPLGVVVHAETFTGIEWQRRTNPRPATRSHVEVVATNFSPDGHGGVLCALGIEDCPCGLVHGSHQCVRPVRFESGAVRGVSFSYERPARAAEAAMPEAE